MSGNGTFRLMLALPCMDTGALRAWLVQQLKSTPLADNKRIPTPDPLRLVQETNGSKLIKCYQDGAFLVGGAAYLSSPRNSANARHRGSGDSPQAVTETSLYTWRSRHRLKSDKSLKWLVGKVRIATERGAGPRPLLPHFQSETPVQILEALEIPWTIR